jgi:hypothetical protein
VRASVRIIAVLYVLAALVAIGRAVYEHVIDRFHDQRFLWASFQAIIPLVVGLGLWQSKPLARVGGLLISGWLAAVAVTGLVIGVVGTLRGWPDGASGLVVESPAAGFALLATVLGFAIWQGWVLWHPATQKLFKRAA